MPSLKLSLCNHPRCAGNAAHGALNGDPWLRPDMNADMDADLELVSMEMTVVLKQAMSGSTVLGRPEKQVPTAPTPKRCWKM